MPGPLVRVATSETSQSGGVSLSTGTLFVAAPASYGPETPTLVRGLTELAALFGPRSEAESQKLYDALNAFFVLGGNRAYVQRIGTAAGVAAKLELEDTAKAKVVTVTAKYKGTFGNGIKLEVKENEAKTAFQLVILNSEGEVLETAPEFAKASELITWGKTHEAYVVITGAGSANKLEKLVATKLATGANPTVNEASTIKAVEGFGKQLGPGTLIVLGAEATKEAVHTTMAEWSLTNKGNRLAACDLKEAETKNVTVATLTGEKGVYSTTIAGNMIFTASTVIVQGLVAGTTRTVPGSVIVAALRARVAKTGNDNQAPCGPEWSLAPFVVGFTNNFSQEQIETLSTAGINSFAEKQGNPCLYGFVTALSPEKDKIFWQASASAARMALVAKAEVILETYEFKTIDGRKRLIHRLAADLQGVGKEMYEANALFGLTPQEAFAVDVDEPVNTLATMQAGELNAEMIVRFSPYVNIASALVVSVPITEAV